MKNQDISEFLAEKLAERAAALKAEQQRLAIRRAELVLARDSIAQQLTEVDTDIAALAAQVSAQVAVSLDVAAIGVKK
ncbi:MAG: hypothetical protein QM813_16990 [Verrucomicrobiota bacterium]